MDLSPGYSSTVIATHRLSQPGSFQFPPLALHPSSWPDFSPLLSDSLLGKLVHSSTQSDVIVQGATHTHQSPAATSKTMALNITLNGNQIIASFTSDQTINGSFDQDVMSVIGSNNVINASAGNDHVAVVGHYNRLNGDDGSDTLAAVGNSNSLDGGAGNDTLEAGGGNNTLTGGPDSDRFGLPDRNDSPFVVEPQGQSWIVDFTPGIDHLSLPTITTWDGLSTQSRILDFNELSMVQQGQNTAIDYQGDVLAVLENVQPGQLTVSDFIQPVL